MMTDDYKYKCNEEEENNEVKNLYEDSEDEEESDEPDDIPDDYEYFLPLKMRFLKKYTKTRLYKSQLIITFL